MIIPLQKDQKLLQEIHRKRKMAGIDHFDVWWLGQSGFLLQWNGRCLLFDPYLSDSLTKKYAGTNKPHVRMSERVIDPALLDCIDVVTSSHNHTDHLDGETLMPLLKANPDITFVIPEANRGLVADRIKCNLAFPVGMNDGEKKEIKGFTFYGVPSAHNSIERDESGNCKFMGFVVQFGNWSVYHSGDTLLYDGMVDLFKPFKLDVAFLPINGNDPSRGVAGNMNAREAAEFGKQTAAKLVIPHHYNMFEFNTANPKDFAAEAKFLKQPNRILRLGEHVAYPEVN